MGSGGYPDQQLDQVAQKGDRRCHADSLGALVVLGAGSRDLPGFDGRKAGLEVAQSLFDVCVAPLALDDPLGLAALAPRPNLSAFYASSGL